MRGALLLWFSVPIAVVGFAVSAMGVFLAFPYAHETAVWAAQGRGQDMVDLAVFPLLLGVATAAALGSAAAYLAWLGLTLYVTYSFVLYAGFVHFGALFPAYVAVLGLSAYAFAWGVLQLDPQLLRDMLAGAPVKTIAIYLVAVSAIFYLLELVPDLVAIAHGSVPPDVAESGLAINPVHLLDMALVLPAVALAGVALWRRRGLGYVLAPVLLMFLGTLAVAIGGMFVATAAAGLPVAWPPVVVFALAAASSFALMLRLLMGADRGVQPFRPSAPA